MTIEPTAPRPRSPMNPRRSLSAPGDRRRRAHSYLVRLWMEPRELDGEDDRMRGYVRDLRTGEETYLSDPDELGRFLSRQIALGTERNVPAPEDTDE